MAKFVIAFETDAEVTEHDLHFLLTTQLNVYCNMREPLEDYLATRYKEADEALLAMKRASLTRLLQLAHDLNRTKEIFGQ